MLGGFRDLHAVCYCVPLECNNQSYFLQLTEEDRVEFKKENPFKENERVKVVDIWANRERIE